MPARRKQLGMGADFGNSAIAQNDGKIGGGHRGKAMGHQESDGALPAGGTCRGGVSVE